MRLSSSSLLALVLLAASSVDAARYTKVPLKSIKTLTFYPDTLTTSRRGAPIQQLTCKGPVCSRFQHLVHGVQCTNQGDDGTGNIQWRCETDLPESLKLGRVEVSCEGWSRPGDANVLAGSCGLEYQLIKVDNPSGGGGGRSHKDGDGDFPTDRILGFVFKVIWFSALGFIVYLFLSSWLGRRRALTGSTFPPSDGAYPGGGLGGGGWGPGGGGGGGGIPGGPPPPPYTPGGGGGGGGPSKSEETAGQGWRPGFGTGLGLGAAAAWLANRSRTNQHRPQPQHRVPNPGDYHYGGIGDDDRYGHRHGGANWGGGDGRAGPSRNSGSGGGGRGSPSTNLGETRTTTGFGGSNVR